MVVALTATQDMKHSKKATWGGKRRGAGRKHTLSENDRLWIASIYYSRMQRIPAGLARSSEAINAADARIFSHGVYRRRDAVIRKLAEEYRVTPRMIERILAEFLPHIRAIPRLDRAQNFSEVVYTIDLPSLRTRKPSSES